MSKFLFTIIILLASQVASASLLVNPTGGASVGFAADTTDDSVTRDIDGAFSLFGTSITSINIASKGYLSTAAASGFFFDRTLHDLAAVTGGDVIAPFYDDLVFGSGTSVTDQSVANTYYAVTFQSIYGFNDTTPGDSSDFQVVLIMADTTIGGFHFQAGDIAISYGNLQSVIANSTFTVGVASIASRTGITDNSDGPLSDFSSLPTGSQFLLYRFNGDYDVSVQSTVPEPATFALGGLGLIAVSVLKRRRP